MQPNEVNRSIGEVTEVVLLWRKETRAELATLLGLSVKSVNRRIGGLIPWEAWEVKAMADHFGLPIDRFYGGPAGLFRGAGGDSTAGYLLSAHAAA